MPNIIVTQLTIKPNGEKSFFTNDPEIKAALKAQKAARKAQQVKFDAELKNYVNNFLINLSETQNAARKAEQTDFEAEQTDFEAEQTDFEAEQTDFEAEQTDFEAEQTTTEKEDTLNPFLVDMLQNFITP